MGSEVKTQEISKKMRDKKKLLLLLLLLLCAGITVLFLALQKSGADKTEWLLKKLDNPSAKTVEINDRIVITKPITVNGEKTITGTGTIIFKPESSQKMKYESYRIPEGECEAFEIADLTQMKSMFEVAKSGNLIISGELTLDADNKSMCVNVNESGKLIVSETATLKNGLGANIFSDGEISVTGGSVKADEGYNIVSNGSMVVSGGEIIGSGERMMNIVACGDINIQGGRIAEAKGTNIYLLDGQLTISGGIVNGASIDNVFAKAGNIDITEGTLSEGMHGIHNMCTAKILGGTYENNTSHVYNEGNLTADKVSFGNSFGSNIVNTGKNAQMKAVGVVIESATSHGVYNVRGAKLDAENLTVKSSLAKGIHNGGGYFTGKNITIIRASGVGVGNDIEKGWTGDSEVTIDGLKILKASYHSLTNANGVMNIKDAELGLISANCIQITGGTLNLEDANIKGTSGTGTFHVIYIQNGIVNAENVVIERSVSRGIQNRGGEFNGKNITISNTGGTAVGNMVSADGVTNGNITIDGLEISGASGYSIQNSGKGTISISNGIVKLTDRTAVRAEDGEIRLSKVEIEGVGTEKEATTKYGGITSVGGKITLNDVKVTNMLARGISLTSGEIVGSGIKINKTGGTGIAVEGGNVKLSNVITQNVKGYNVDVKKGTAEISKSTLNKGTTNSIRLENGTLSLEEVVVNGTPQIKNKKGEMESCHGILALAGKLSLTNVTVQNTTGRGLDNRGASVIGKTVVIKDAGGTAIRSSAGATKLDGVAVTAAVGYSIQNVEKGKIAIANGTVEINNRTAVQCEEGTIELSNTEIIGVGNAKDAATNYGGITVVGGKVTLKDVKVTNVLARGISLTGGNVVGSGLAINKTGGTGIAVEGGTVKLSDVTTQNVKGYNVDVQKGTAEISESTLNKGTTNSIRLQEGSLSLNGVVVNGTPQIKNSKGEMESCHGILAMAGKLSLENVRIQNTTGRGLDNRGASITGKKIEIKDVGGTAVRNTVGSTKLEELVVSGAAGYGIQNVEKGKIAVTNSTVEISNRTAVQCEEGVIELTNTEIIGVENEKEAATNYGGITVVSGKVELKDVKVTNVLARGISLTGGNIVGSGLVVNKTGGTGIAVEGGTLKLSNVTTQDVKGYNLDVQKGTAEISKSTLNKGATHSVRLEKGTLTMKDTLVNGTPQASVVGGEKKVYIGVSAKAGNLNLINVTVKDTSGRNISNEGATLNGVNITLEKVQNATSLYNTGSITIDGLSIVNGSSYAIDNHGSMSLTRAKVFDCANRAINNQENASLSLDEYEIRGNNGQAIYNDGEVHLGDGIIDSGANDAITVRKGSVTMDGRIDITTTGYAVKLTDNGKLYMDSDVVFLSNAKIYLPKKSPIKVLGNGIGNTTAQRIELAPTSTEYGTVYVETTSEGVSKDLELANIFIVTTASVVADGKNMVAAELREVEYDEEATTVEVSTWAEIKNAIEGAEEGDFLRIVLKNNIDVTDEGVIKQGEDDRVKVLLTDEGKGYKINRTNLKNALFTINVGSEMILDGTLTLDGASSKEAAASEAILLNKGTLTINKDVTIQNGYKSEKANSLDSGRSTCSAGAIENIGILNLHGTVTISSSGNGSALSSLGGTLSINGARLNNNIGRALRIVDGEALIRDTEMNHNGNVSGGGSLLIDDADVTIYDSYFNNNTSTGPGGAIQTTSANCKLFMKNCEVKYNTADTRGGGININEESSQNITFENCIISYNTSSTDAGGGVYISENSKVQMADCTISQNVCETSGKQGGGIYLNTAELTLDGCTVEKNGVQGAGGGIRVGTKAVLTLQGNTKISDNTATSYGTQIWVNAADATINWGSDVLMSVTNLNVASDSVGMIGLNKPGVNIVLTGAMKEDNLVTVKAKELVDGNVILSGYNANDPNAEINTWIQAAADNFTIVSPIGLKVGTDGTIEKGQIKVSASSWEELKAVIENEEYKGYDLAVTLKSNITEADDAIIVDGVTITLTDNESEYTITRTNKTKAMFDIKNGSALILDGKLTLDGNSSSSQKAAEAIILNRGTLTINSNVIIKNGYKEAAKTSLDETKTSLSGGAIENIGTLNVYGTITASGSGNNSAISVLDGTFTATGAKLNSNQGRAARIVKGNTTFTNVEINNNIASDSGAGLLIDYATVVISGGSISSNKATGNGGAIVVQSTASLQMSDCIVNNNQATVNGGAFSITTSSKTVVFTNCKIGVDGENKAGNKASGQGGAFYIKGDCTVTLSGCTVANNESVKRGGAVRIDKGTLNANNSNFNFNYGKQSGGAFFIYEVAEVELTSCNMSENRSDGNGKTVHIWMEDAELTLIGCTINGVASANAETTEIYKQANPTVTHQ